MTFYTTGLFPPQLLDEMTTCQNKNSGIREVSMIPNYSRYEFQIYERLVISMVGPTFFNKLYCFLTHFSFEKKMP
jgi:hypothetical protein